MAFAKLVLEKDVPAIIALTAVTGKIQPSTIEGAASDVRFTLVDGRTAFFPFSVADQILKAGIQPGVPFEITQIGKKKSDVRIRNIGASRDYSPELEASIRMANEKKAIAAAEADRAKRLQEEWGGGAVSAAPSASTTATYNSGNGNAPRRLAESRPLTDAEFERAFGPEPPEGAGSLAPPRQAAAPAAPATSGLSPMSARFMSAYKDAIDTLVEAKVYAQRQGLALDVRCEDVRCLAATMMIQQNQNGGAR